MKWEPGARAEIIVSEHPNNAGRIVTLLHDFMRSGFRAWAVEDGKPFTAYHPEAHCGEDIDARPRFTSNILGIEQWKLRLLEE